MILSLPKRWGLFSQLFGLLRQLCGLLSQLCGLFCQLKGLLDQSITCAHANCGAATKAENNMAIRINLSLLIVSSISWLGAPEKQADIKQRLEV